MMIRKAVASLGGRADDTARKGRHPVGAPDGFRSFRRGRGDRR